jgi:acetyl esterase/lipase
VTLHPQAQAVVELMARGPAPHEVPIADARAALDAGDVLAGEREDVAEVVDRNVPGPDGPIPVRVYRPTRGALPVAVFFHGGGFSAGSLASHDRLCRALANRSGCVVVAVDYRLAPEHPFPAGIEDAYAATAWVSDHGEELGTDRTRLAVGGDSGGGTFGASVALLARDRGGPPIAFQYLVNPGGLDYDYGRRSFLDNAEGCFLTLDLVKWIEEQYFADPADMDAPLASLNRVDDLTGAPPAFVLTAEHDPVRDQGIEFVRRLRADDVPVRHTDYPGMIHGWVNFKGHIDDGERALDELAAALRDALSP